jgi:ATP-dependent DNA helicase RecQ
MVYFSSWPETEVPSTEAMTMQEVEMELARKLLQEVWGYSAFRPLQEPSIACALRHQDSLTVLPTGGGKSLCFQVPALCFDGMAVVVSPLISLMQDQVDSLRACGINAYFVNSTQSVAEKRQIAQEIRQGRVKLLYMAPERLLGQRTLEFLQQCRVSFFAIDEAHCISAWGHDFRPEYRGLRVLKQRFPQVAVHAYTATASDSVRRDIADQLGLADPEILVGSFDRPNLTFRMIRSQDRLEQVCEVVGRHRGEAGIVYCISRKDVERMAEALSRRQIKALPYHAGMEDAQRKANQLAFINEEVDVIVATVAFGMGIDKPNVRYVVHAGMPKSIEHYQQESGRAGRDGLEAECVLFYHGGDAMTWRRIMEDGAEPEGALRSLDAMTALCTGITCRHRAIVEYFGEEFLSANCGACDICLGEVRYVDQPVVLAQKILSCVLRLRERFGADHTAKVLIGAKEGRILELGHQRLSTYGLLEGEASVAVKAWIQQLIDQRFLLRHVDYQTLAVTEAGRRLLHGDGEVVLTVVETRRTKRAERAPAKRAEVTWEGVDRPLFEHLRVIRRDLAEKRSVPAYIIFGDATLRELARQRPSNLVELGRIRGIGERKLEEFGSQILTAIAEFDSRVDVH